MIWLLFTADMRNFSLGRVSDWVTMISTWNNHGLTISSFNVERVLVEYTTDETDWLFLQIQTNETQTLTDCPWLRQPVLGRTLWIWDYQIKSISKWWILYTKDGFFCSHPFFRPIQHRRSRPFWIFGKKSCACKRHPPPHPPPPHPKRPRFSKHPKWNQKSDEKYPE